MLRTPTRLQTPPPIFFVLLSLALAISAPLLGEQKKTARVLASIIVRAAPGVGACFSTYYFALYPPGGGRYDFLRLEIFDRDRTRLQFSIHSADRVHVDSVMQARYYIEVEPGQHELHLVPTSRYRHTAIGPVAKIRSFEAKKGTVAYLGTVDVHLDCHPPALGQRSYITIRDLKLINTPDELKTTLERLAMKKAREYERFNDKVQIVP